jgi:hypothetical protein
MDRLHPWNIETRKNNMPNRSLGKLDPGLVTWLVTLISTDLGSILKNGIPTLLVSFKCLQLFKFFSHDTCRVLGLENKQIFTQSKALEGELYHIWSCIIWLCIAWPQVCHPTQKPSSPPPKLHLGKERFSIKRRWRHSKCPCSTWTVDFQHLKILNAFIEYFQVGFVMHICHLSLGLRHKDNACLGNSVPNGKSCWPVQNQGATWLLRFVIHMYIIIK